jgi:hypothetical protein
MREKHFPRTFVQGTFFEGEGSVQLIKLRYSFGMKSS